MASSMSPILLGILSAVFFAATIFVNATYGAENGTVSNKYDLCITPAGYAFSIWGLIYLGLLGFVVMLFVQPPSNKMMLYDLFWVSCILNAAWIITFTQEWLYVQAIVILCLAVSLFGLYTQ
ncbi:TspO/MBR-related protein, partial [Kipferlia bialata]|eukprot:g15353.t1